MKYNLKFSLNLSQSEKKVSDRISEVKNAASYLKYFPNPEIDLFQIALNDKNDLKALLRIIEKHLENVSYLSFYIKGWRKKKKGNKFRLFFAVESLGETSLFLFGIEKELVNSNLFQNIKYSWPENNFDILIAESDNYGDFFSLWEKLGERNPIISRILLGTIYRRSNKPLYAPRKFCYTFDVLKVVVYRNETKYYEYSLPCGERIRPDDKSAIKKTYEKYRKLKKYELPCKFNLSDKNLYERIFVTSDLHLGHKDIIDMTARPFRKNDLKLMNEVLISNWNNTVSDNDTVIFVGDLTYNSHHSDSQKYLERLNGKIIFIRGNHDAINCKSLLNYEFEYKNQKFYCVHNPKNAPLNYEGWIIHGHTHNSRMCLYPFISFINRTINISCELTEFCPVGLDEIVRIIEICQRNGCGEIYSIDNVLKLQN